MEPQGMVEARSLDLPVEDGRAMGDQAGIEQQQVGSIGEHALVEGGFVRQRLDRANPDVEFRLQAAAAASAP